MTMQLHLQQVPARNGRLWIRHGFKVFQRQPLALASLFGLFLFFAFVTMLLPAIGMLLLIGALPLLSLGFMLATHLVLQKKTPTAGVFIAPLKLTPARRRSQLLLCAGYALAAVLIGLFSDWADGGTGQEFMRLLLADDASGVADALSDSRLFWGLGLRFGLATLLTVPYWHAPALVHWGGQGAAQALFSSALALWRNRAAFLLNALLWGAIMLGVGSVEAVLLNLFGLAEIKAIVQMVSSLILSTVFYASLYFSFVDCFMFGAPNDVLSD